MLKSEIGSFVESEYGHRHYYGPCASAWGIENGLPHEIDTIDGPRCARILKTVAYVAVDEDEYGKPVLEKWTIKGHWVYDRGVSQP